MKSGAFAALFVAFLVVMGVFMIAAAYDGGNNDGILYEDEYVTMTVGYDDVEEINLLAIKAKDGTDHDWRVEWYTDGDFQGSDTFTDDEFFLAFHEGETFIVRIYVDGGYMEYTIDPNAKTVAGEFFGY